MIAWNAYKETAEYANTKKWAVREEHVEGSLWAAFIEGFARRPPLIEADVEAVLRAVLLEYSESGSTGLILVPLESVVPAMARAVLARLTTKGE